MKLSDLIVAGAIVSSLEATTRDEAIDELARALAEAGVVPRSRVAEVTQAVLAREAMTTTGIGKGVAVPHAKVNGVTRSAATIGRAEDGIDFASLDGRPVHSIVLLLSSPDRPDEHLQAMEAILTHLHREAFRKALRQSRTPEEIADVVRAADETWATWEPVASSGHSAGSADAHREAYDDE